MLERHTIALVALPAAGAVQVRGCVGCGLAATCSSVHTPWLEPRLASFVTHRLTALYDYDVDLLRPVRLSTLLGLNCSQLKEQPEQACSWSSSPTLGQL